MVVLHVAVAWFIVCGAPVVGALRLLPVVVLAIVLAVTHGACVVLLPVSYVVAVDW